MLQGQKHRAFCCDDKRDKTELALVLGDSIEELQGRKCLLDTRTSDVLECRGR